jgi:hypothetical protein
MRATKAASQRLAGYTARLTRGFQYRNRSDTDYGLSVAAPSAGVVVVVSVVVVFVPVVPVPVVPVPVSSPLQPVTTRAAITIIMANKLLIARSPEMKWSAKLAPDLSGYATKYGPAASQRLVATDRDRPQHYAN